MEGVLDPGGTLGESRLKRERVGLPRVDIVREVDVMLIMLVDGAFLRVVDLLRGHDRVVKEGDDTRLQRYGILFKPPCRVQI